MTDDTAAQELLQQVTGRTDWDMLDPVTQESWRRRARGDKTFIASGHVNQTNEEAPPAISLPDPECRARPAEPGEIPRGAATVVKRAREHGWDVSVSHARGPWIQADGSHHVLSSVLVRGRRAGQKFAALWVDKDWLKAAGYKLELARAPGGVTLNSNSLKTFIESEAPHD